ncbi:putative acetyltransferase [Flavobacteriaceae bacterium 3519-10]|nr:putative acetyltransferase [Flavobacteriaceae bacterium 3519-10]
MIEAVKDTCNIYIMKNSGVRTFLIKIIRLNLKTLLINWFTKGNRKNNLIIVKSKFTSFIHHNAEINLNKGNLILNDTMRVSEPFVGMLEMQNNSTINVQGEFIVNSGMHIIVLDNAKLNLGSGYINRNVKIRCSNEITIGKNVAISENVTIWDSDGHAIIGRENDMTKPVFIGNHVWIGNNVTILKGVQIGDNSVIAAGSVVIKDIPANCLAGGTPAKILKQDINWQ